MKNPFVQRVGGVLSADIAVPDHARELDFYSTILTTGHAPLWRDDLTNNLGTPVIGLGVRTPEYATLPLQWMPHFQVADVAASVAKAVEMGGKDLMHDEHYQWAGLADHDGAAFGIIPVVTEETYAASRNDRIGRISWLSLTVPNAVSSSHFYQQVVGWSTKAVNPTASDEPSSVFEMQIDSDTSAAEIRQFHDELQDIPPVWILHLPVDDLVESLRRVCEGGGEVIKQFAEEKCAIVRDPVGVCIALQAC